MTETKSCPKCGSPVPSGAPSGICPKCLMQAGMESEDESHNSDTGSTFAATAPHFNAFVPPEPASIAPFFPQLEIIELLGLGGMGAVYKARQTKLDRFVALKIIRPDLSADAAFAERFNREAKVLARLIHPNIVAVHDFGEVNSSPQGQSGTSARTMYYFVMEYVDGPDLRQLMQEGLQPEQALAIIPRICEALQVAHDHGVVHRDIKPENVLLDRNGQVKIADFGLAKFDAKVTENATLTRTHQVMGTPRYMAPEQIASTHDVDHRADIYSLGVVFYEMLTGEVPVGNFQPPSKKVEVDVRLDDVVLRSMAREPERRYQHVSDLKTDVEAVSSKNVFHGAVENQKAATSSGLSHGERMGLLTVWFFGALVGYEALLEITRWAASLGGWTEAFNAWEAKTPTPLLVALWLIGGWLIERYASRRKARRQQADSQTKDGLDGGNRL